MSLKTLSEAIILQSTEDLLSASHKGECIEFFSGEGFRLCAELAGMTFDEKLKFLHLLLGCIARGKGIKDCSAEMVAENRKTPKRWGHSHKGRKSVAMSAV